MPSQVYKWKRFWCPLSGWYNLADDGYLYDPKAEWGKIYNPHLVTFEDISKTPCLVFLGEPGIGKTTTLKQVYEQVCAQASKCTDACIWFNLGDYESDRDLCLAIFQSKTFQDWIHGTHSLHLFLDSLDEGLLSIKILVRILKREIDKITKLPCSCIYFRISCRTADWSESLEEKLKEKWGKSNFGIYELVPLLRADVIEASTKNDLVDNKFLQHIFERQATPLAIKPITLDFLLSTYRKNGQFPRSQKDLYEQGCLQLCEEVNQDRRESGFVGELSAKQRLILASRIAALILFANRTAIWTSPKYGDLLDSDIAIRGICLGSESINQQEFLINEDSVKEVLSVTGLFSYRGNNRMSFTHQTYTEFLAVWYLDQHETPLNQVMKLIVSPEDPERKLIPQLHETAAWLASMRTDVLQEIMKTDPDVLLRSDIPTDANLRAAIVDNLLKQYEQGKLFDSHRDNYPTYEKFKHSGLAVQLLPYIQDLSKPIDARNAMI
jgi:predicted NACHT family NTPase